MEPLADITPAALEQLEFHKVREILARYARGEFGRVACLALHPLINIGAIEDRLDQVHQYTAMMALPSRPQLEAYEDVSASLLHLAVDGYVLTQEELHEIARQMEQVRLIHLFFAGPEQQRDYPALAVWTTRAANPAAWIKSIRAILDEKGDVRPDASPALLEIAREIGTEAAKLNKEFVRLIARYRQEGWLADNAESVRSGRRVLCVKAEYKRKVSGIIHDESATGRTAFIEPEAIVGINNRIVELEGDFKKEVFRLLKELCHTLRPHKEHLEDITRLIHHWDLIQCLAFMAVSYRGQRPKLQAEPVLHMLQARHPLLLLKNKARHKAVIPFDLALHPPNRLLILSGPNAGGKSILMKATGLIQVMAQCGMPVPADGSTVIGIARRICVDIGDQQSIEEDLSTYSSRLHNMKDMLDGADAGTMILADEFGSGTDPKIGGAIAEAILDALVRRNVSGVITTHYPNIKMYAHHTRGVVNGAMMFDKEKIEPTYRLKIGKPGSSFAFEIAERTGLPADVIGYARRSAGDQAVEMEDLIHDLDEKRLRLDADLKDMAEKQKDLDRLIAAYEQMHRDLEIQKKKFKIERKKAGLTEATQYTAELKQLLKDLKKERDAGKAQQQIDALKARQKEAGREISTLAGELTEAVSAKHEFRAGDHVKLVSSSETGVISGIQKDKAVVIIGQLQMTLPLAQLMPAKKPVETRQENSIKKDTGDYSRLENELDIRGMLPEEAGRYIERFIDAAFMSSRDRIRIVHGKGTGALRQLVAKTMKGYPFKQVFHPPREEGGDGVTIGDL